MGYVRIVLCLLAVVADLFWLLYLIDPEMWK